MWRRSFSRTIDDFFILTLFAAPDTIVKIYLGSHGTEIIIAWFYSVFIAAILEVLPLWIVRTTLGKLGYLVLELKHRNELILLYGML
ncbi:hypothetical protein [Candidatus Nitrosacidococcus sp. I8]|uniref:hypothetical protein n=1 Tax=Candidatus Nitrosacidococcus sp. I8 TaxID=2942908 RepID=UPI0022279CAA|nr:hypothetical protein [Candidatus Nitrosacidococcus sp. I8]